MISLLQAEPHAARPAQHIPTRRSQWQEDSLTAGSRCCHIARWATAEARICACAHWHWTREASPTCVIPGTVCRPERDNAEAPCNRLPGQVKPGPAQHTLCGRPAPTWICASRCRSLPVSTSCSCASRSAAPAPEEDSATTSLLGGMSTAGTSLTSRSNARSNSAWATL